MEGDGKRRRQDCKGLRRAPAEPFLSRSALVHYNTWRGHSGGLKAPPTTSRRWFCLPSK